MTKQILVNGNTDYLIEQAIREWWNEANAGVYSTEFDMPVFPAETMRDLRHKIMEHLTRG